MGTTHSAQRPPASLAGIGHSTALVYPADVGCAVTCDALYLSGMFTWWELIDLAGSPRNPLAELRLVLRLLGQDHVEAEPVRATAPVRTLARAA